MKSLWRAIGFLTHYWPAVLGAMLALLIALAANLAFPRLIGMVIDRGIIPSDLSQVLLTSVLLVLVSLIRGLSTFAQNYLAERAAQSATYDLRNLIYRRIQSLSFAFHDASQTGQLMTRVTSDVDLVKDFLGSGVLHFLGALVTIIGTTAMLLLINWRLALLVLPIVPAIMIIFALVIVRARPLFTLVQEQLAALNTILQENLAGVRVVKAFVREPYEHGRYGSANALLLGTNIKVVRTFSTVFPLIFLVASIGTALVMYFGGRQVIAGSLTLGELVAFNTYLGMLTFPAFSLGMVSSMMSRAGASARRIFEVVDTENTIQDPENPIEPHHLRGAVRFEQVSFRYAGSDVFALTDVDFAIEPGMTVAIVGPTGSGKSSIVNLIPRFYDPVAGRVLIDGYDVRSLKLSGLRRQVGVVMQDTLLFSGSIAENIAYGDPDASQDEIEVAAKLAHAHQFIIEQPEGYATRIGEGGVGLSGGQMQRIAIARALLLSPAILIMDDSTSAVDAETEYQIQQSLKQLAMGRTTFIIAQRISTVRRADLILVIDRSRLVGSGTHDQLLATSQLYGEIVDSQLIRDEVPSTDNEAGAGEPGGAKP